MKYGIWKWPKRRLCAATTHRIVLCLKLNNVHEREPERAFLARVSWQRTVELSENHSKQLFTVAPQLVWRFVSVSIEYCLTCIRNAENESCLLTLYIQRIH